MARWLLIFVPLFRVTLLIGFSQEFEPLDADIPLSQRRPFVEIVEQDIKPSVQAIAPIDNTNVFFLNKQGQVGVAKFSPGLSLISWELYSKVKLNALKALGLGPNYSLVTASPFEVTQAFDTLGDGSLDFFEGIVRTWPGRKQGVTVTAGPVPDAEGRLLFALSPHAAEDGEAPLARLVAWHPDQDGLKTVTESQLLISSFAIGPKGLLAARLSMPNYTEGFYISLTELKSSRSNTQEPAKATIPQTLPSLLIPAELTGGDEPTQICFFTEEGVTKLILTCPTSRELIEVVPEKEESLWQGAILLRSLAPSSIASVVEMNTGSLLGGGPEGFFSLEIPGDEFRIKKVAIVEDGIALSFSTEVNRKEAIMNDSYTIQLISFRGQNKTLKVTPVIESDGKTVILKTDEIGKGVVLRVACENLSSASGDPLFSRTVFYTIHEG